MNILLFIILILSVPIPEHGIVQDKWRGKYNYFITVQSNKSFYYFRKCPEKLYHSVNVGDLVDDQFIKNLK